MIEALMYGVMERAKMENLLKEPPEKVFMIFRIPLPWKTASRNWAFTPGTGM